MNQIEDDLKVILRKNYSGVVDQFAEFRSVADSAQYNQVCMDEDIRQLAQYSDCTRPLDGVAFSRPGAGLINIVYGWVMKMLRPLSKLLLARQSRYNRINLYLWCQLKQLRQQVSDLEKRLDESKNG